MIPDTNQLPALINLLDEPDEKTFGIVREKIFSFGESAVTPLQEALESALDSTVQRRIEGLIYQIQREGTIHSLINWMKLGSSDLLKGFLLVSKMEHPAIDEEEIAISIEQIRMDAWLELNDNLTALENVKVLNHILYDMHRFEANRTNLFAPANLYLNTLLETRKGNPLTLGMLYLILSQKLNIPIYGVNLPQHFILAYLTESHSQLPTDQEVLFYINPFNKGAVFTRREIDLFVRQMKLKPTLSYFTPCTNVDIIHRLINNLILTYTQLGNSEKVEEWKTLQEEIRTIYE